MQKALVRWLNTNKCVNRHKATPTLLPDLPDENSNIKDLKTSIDQRKKESLNSDGETDNNTPADKRNVLDKELAAIRDEINSALFKHIFAASKEKPKLEEFAEKLEAYFNEGIDKNKEGKIDKKRFLKAMKTLKSEIDESKVELVYKHYHANESGLLSPQDFIDFLAPPEMSRQKENTTLHASQHIEEKHDAFEEDHNSSSELVWTTTTGVGEDFYNQNIENKILSLSEHLPSLQVL